MSIDVSDIKFYKSTIISDASDNGGVISSNELVDNVKNNLWPDVSQSERTAGSTKYRKVFIKVENDDDLTLLNPRLFIETNKQGDDRILIFAGTQSDTQNDITGSERLYGSGTLDSNISAGATSLDVNVEDAGDAIFQNGDVIRISDKTSVNYIEGNEEFVTLDPSIGVSWSGNVATLTLTSGTSLTYGYAATSTKVASVIEPSDIRATSDSWSESSASGTYDETTYPLVLDHIGTTEDDWTLSFTSATDFDCSGVRSGSIGSGSTATDFSPNNSDFSKPYFTLDASGWGGTWASGDTITFSTHPAATPVWEKRIVPAGANSLIGNKVILAISGESE